MYISHNVNCFLQVAHSLVGMSHETWLSQPYVTSELESRST